MSAVLNEAFHFFKNHLRQLAMLTMPLIIGVVAIQSWLGIELGKMNPEAPQIDGIHLGVMFLGILLFSWLISTLTLFLQVVSDGHNPTVRQVLFTSLNFVPPMLLTMVFTGMAIFGPIFVLIAALKELGALIGIVVSVFIAVRLSYVNFMVVVEHITPLQAIKDSFNFTKPIFFPTLAILLMSLPISLVFTVIATSVSSLGEGAIFVVNIFGFFFSLFVTVALYRLYMLNRENVHD
ncbi:hypothetical protein JQC92_12220 [Shewanella sp. 202IG2-18]|uniref:hypothetical protein n=1 Tax=Parashewanella hymeniacidonis TaxID=2807618 RepID=UPI0019609C33|nr:hypothetical protein [Parashewanella hymeniacidonis]MBM7072787.1 hypothetical protein [Parashewanella hymeniacidonis]